MVDARRIEKSLVLCRTNKILLFMKLARYPRGAYLPVSILPETVEASGSIQDLTVDTARTLTVWPTL